MSIIHIASSPIEVGDGTEDRGDGRQYCRRCGTVLVDHSGTDHLSERGWRAVFFAAGQLVEETAAGLAGTRLGLLRASDQYCLSESRELAQREDLPCP